MNTLLLFIIRPIIFIVVIIGIILLGSICLLPCITCLFLYTDLLLLTFCMYSTRNYYLGLRCKSSHRVLYVLLASLFYCMYLMYHFYERTSCRRTAATICLRPLQVDYIFVFIRQVAPILACWLFKTSATS